MKKSYALVSLLLVIFSVTSAVAAEGDLDTTFDVDGKVTAC